MTYLLQETQGGADLMDASMRTEMTVQCIKEEGKLREEQAVMRETAEIFSHVHHHKS
jgi:hypothetical protein